MASPLRANSGRKNLVPGKSPGRPKQTAETKEVQRISKKLLLDPRYLKTLRGRLNAGTCQPGVEAMVWYYAFGKPKEEMDVKLPVPIKLVMEYTKDKE